MSNKVILIVIGITIVVLIASHYFYGEHKERVGVEKTLASLIEDSLKVTQDSAEVRIDTFYIKGDTIRLPAEKEMADSGMIFRTELTIPVITGLDTVGMIKQKVSFDSEKEMFNIVIEELIIKPATKYIPVFKKTYYQTAIREVPADPPFYNTFWFGVIFTTVAYTIAIIASVF